MSTPDQTAGDGPPGRRARRWRGPVFVLCLLLALPVAAAGALWLRLGAGPLALPQPLTARIEVRLDAAMTIHGVTLGRVEVSRPPGEGVIELRLIDLRLSDADGAPRAAFPSVAVSLSTRALSRGQVQPTRADLAGAGLQLRRDAAGQIDLDLMAGAAAQTVGLAETLARIDTMFSSPVLSDLEGVTAEGLDLAMADEMTGQTVRARNAQLRLERKDGVLSLTLGGALEGSRDATVNLALTRSASTGATNIGFTFENLAARDVATVGPALAWLDLMRAPISGFMGGALNDDGTLGDLRATLGIGPGQLTLEGADAPLQFNRLFAALRYDAAARRLSFDRLDLEAPELSFAAMGHADADPDGTRYVAQFQMADIRLDRDGLFPAPLTLDGAAIDLRLTLAPQLVVEIGQAVIHDGTLELGASGRITAGQDGLDIALDAHIPEAEAVALLEYWPEAAIPTTRAWLARAVSAGRLHGVDAAFRAAPGAPPAHALSLDFEGVTLSALQSLPPITGGAGYLSLIGTRLILRLDEGQITAPGRAGVALDGSQMVIADTSQRGPDAAIDLALAGGLSDVLTLLTLPPVRLFENSAITPERIGSGGVDMTGRIDTRLMRQDGIGDTRFAFAGQVIGFASDTLVPGRELRADQMQVTVDNDAVAVSGRATFDGVPLTGQWSRALGPDAPPQSQLEARAGLTQARLTALGLALPDWMLSGEAEAAVELSLPDGAAPRLRVASDLGGARLALPPLGWALGAGQTGRLEAEIVLGATPDVPRLSLSGAGLTLEGRVALTPAGSLERLTADRFQLGGWLDVTGALVGRGAAPPAIEITGGTLDLRGAPQGGGAGAGGGGPITATLDRLQISEGIALTDLGSDLTTAGGLSGQFRGLVNGAAPLTGTLVSTEAGPAVRVRAEDGGAVLRAAGVFQTAYGGAMELILQATGDTGVYDGTLSIDGPRLRDAPVMAELLNLISVVGLLEQLGGEGINLGEVEAAFRLTPTRLILREGAAVGPSLGLSMDGTYELASGRLDMQGVVSPLYVVNGLMGALFAPRREGLFGFSYRLTGAARAPQVTVNPLSILTPGIFREIFRRPPPDMSDTR